MDFKEILGDLYTDEIGTKINESGIKFADLSKGEYVSKDKYDTAVNDAKTYKSKYETLESTKNDDTTITTLTAERDDYKSKYESQLNVSRGYELSKAGIDDKFKDFVMSEINKNVNDDTDFDTALKDYVEKNPQYKKVESGRKVNSSFSISGGNKNVASSNSVFNNAILNAVGRK